MINVVFTILYYILGIRLVLRGKVHVEWRVTKAGERRTVRDDEYYIDEKKVIWGKGMYYSMSLMTIDLK
jgi:hypothetical protein